MLKFSKKYFFLKDFFCFFEKGSEASFEIFESILFVEMKSLKLNNYSTKTWWTYSSTTVVAKILDFALCDCDVLDLLHANEWS
jgi:hypothetical protein